MTAEEAVAYGLADKVIVDRTAAAAPKDEA